ncbi:MAG TPA: FadR/GntR family transcriptional regulator [Alphaproteobacteria bacterium]|nr:FadR/GntR family transcriptional regulator [Alphaproteobacteria bacterium]
MSKEFPAIVTASLAKQITESLRQMILAGKIKFDERLPTEDELAARFGVSRPTVREALKRLAAENLIHSRRGPTGGNFVKRPTPEEVSGTLANSIRLLVGLGEFGFEDILEARLELESMCCRLAATRRSDAQLEGMRREIEEQQSDDLTDVEFCASDVRFHQILVEATGNPILEFMLVAIGDALQPITNLALYRFRERQIIVEQHRRLLAALERQNADEAIAVLVEQTAYLRRTCGKAIEWQDARRRKSRSVAAR